MITSMKYVVLSFDDGRKDFYTNAFPVLKSYGLSATLNVVTGYIGRNDLTRYGQGFSECVSWKELDEMYEYGIEIANHSSDHSNKIESVIRGAQELCAHLNMAKVGFASPASAICKANIGEYLQISNCTSYIRSGNRARRDGLGHAAVYATNSVAKLPSLYYLYNRRNFIDCRATPPCFYPSASCNCDNDANQVLSCIDKMPDEHALILLLHSILQEDEREKCDSRWCNSVDELNVICRYLAEDESIRVITNNELNAMLNYPPVK